MGGVRGTTQFLASLLQVLTMAVEKDRVRMWRNEIPGPKKLSETVPGPPLYYFLPERCSAVYYVSQSQLSIFVVFNSFVVKS